MAKKRPKRATNAAKSGQKRPKAAMPKHRNYTIFTLALAVGASNAQAAKAGGGGRGASGTGRRGGERRAAGSDQSLSRRHRADGDVEETSRLRFRAR